MTVRILTGDVRERLAELPDASVQCCVTSPPYYGLRSYGTEPQVWGGDPECNHEWTERRYYVEGGGGAQKSGEAFSEPGDANAQRIRDARWRDDGLCVTCGAWLGHLGLEPTLAMFVEHLVAVFRDVRRVLRDDGTCWLNLGDSYAAQRGNGASSVGPKQQSNNGSLLGALRLTDGMKAKDLMMVPARVALALQDDGWWLRSDIIWAKKNCMPESVTDRPTSSHEHIFLLTKSARYYYDAEAVREDAIKGDAGAGPRNWRPGQNGNERTHAGQTEDDRTAGRNQRNVWHLATEPFREAHFATFPTEIPRRCIKAGTSEKGQCAACGAPWVRVVARGASVPDVSQRATSHYNTAERYGVNNGGNGGSNKLAARMRSGENGIQTLGWQPSCTCDAGAPIPQTVLDPFLGSGTTLLVADQLGRDAIGIELNPEYVAMAERRVREDAPMFAEVTA